MQLVQQQALMASMMTQCPGGNALFNPPMQGVAVTQAATPHVAAAPAFSAPIITAPSSGNAITAVDNRITQDRVTGRLVHFAFLLPHATRLALPQALIRATAHIHTYMQGHF